VAAGRCWRARPCAHGRLQINNGEALRTAALHGLGIVLQSALLLAADVEAGRLVQLFPKHGQAGRPMHVVYAHDRYHSTRLRSFIDFLVERFPPAPLASTVRKQSSMARRCKWPIKKPLPLGSQGRGFRMRLSGST
jgi:DNA-binding transcriptional LysR family regulator